MSDVSILRLYLLRGAYLLLVVGLGTEIWPGLFLREASPPLMVGIVDSLLGGVSLIAILGICYPLKMLPLLMFEALWKATWLAFIALPLWLKGQIDTATADMVFACAMGIIFIIAIP